MVFQLWGKNLEKGILNWKKLEEVWYWGKKVRPKNRIRPLIKGFTWKEVTYLWPRERQGTFIRKPDGRSAYISHSHSSYNWLVQFNLSTPWDTNTMTGESRMFVDIPVLNSCFISSDGKRLYVNGNRENTRIHQYSLNTPRDITTASYVRTSGWLQYQTTWMYIVGGGEYLYLLRYASQIYRYRMSVPRDVSTCVFEWSLNLWSGGFHGLFLNPRGTQLFTINRTSKIVYIYTMSTPFYLGSASRTGTMPVSDDMTGLSFNYDGSRMYLLTLGGRIITFSTL